ncbi:3918_t:CDS:2, partial [Dentiscutata erythropus]
MSKYMEKSESSVKHAHSFIEAELHQMNNMTKDDAFQNISNVSDIEDYEDISFATESYEIGLEDYEGASFDEAFQG